MYIPGATGAEAAQLLAEFEASGLSRLGFCGSHGLSLATLTLYQNRRREAAVERLPGSRWLSVELADAGSQSAGWTGSGLAVTLAGGRRIDVRRGLDAQTLAELLGVLERLPFLDPADRPSPNVAATPDLGQVERVTTLG